MKLTQDQREKLIAAIQAAIGITVIALSVRNTAQVQTAQAKKLAARDNRRLEKLHKKEYKLKQNLLKEKYKNKLHRAKKARRKKS